MMATRSSSTKGFGGITSPAVQKSWSFSRQRDYAVCPEFFKHKYIDKLEESVNDAMIRGTLIHNLAEDYVLGYTQKRDDKNRKIGPKKKVTTLAPELSQFEDEFKMLRKVKAQVELMLTYTKDWAEQCEWTDWNRAWVRVKVDAMYVRKDNVLVLIDHKTGRIKTEHREQLSLYAIAGFLDQLNIKKVSTELWYIDHGQIVDEEYSRDQLDALISIWSKRTKGLLTDTTFKPTPSDESCKYCPYKKSKGGPCRF
jgi:CRISPR/Cas system-associated exonuclease Cas4 (RecB family)